MKLTKEDKLLIKKTYEKIKNCDFKNTGMGAGIITEEGEIFFGVSLSIENPAAVCAEPIALGNMITNGGRKVKTIVAVYHNGKIYSPCGCCRELLYELEVGNPWVIIGKNKKVRLTYLLPESNEDGWDD